jgi:nitroreductase
MGTGKRIKRLAATPLRRGPLAERRREKAVAARVGTAGAAAGVSFAAAVEGRMSIRRFRKEPVPHADVERMVALATRAASAGNAQMWRFVAVEDTGVRQAMKAAVEDKVAEMAAWPEVADMAADVRAIRGYATFFADAPLAIAVFGLPYESRLDRMLVARGLSAGERDRLRQRPDLQSIGAAVQLLITAAHALGYGACWMSAPVIAAEAIEELLGAQPPQQLVAIVALGRTAGARKVTKRLPLDEVLRFV